MAHYTINLSDACDEMGDGQCDGSVPLGEGNRNAEGDACSCTCHDEGTEIEPYTVEAMTAWHVAFHANDYATMDLLQRL